jgi:hypothetical protein
MGEKTNGVQTRICKREYTHKNTEYFTDKGAFALQKYKRTELISRMMFRSFGTRILRMETDEEGFVVNDQCGRFV